MNKRTLSLIVVVVLALIAYVYWPRAEAPPVDAPESVIEAPVMPAPTATPVAAVPPAAAIASATPTENQRVIRETKQKRELNYRDLEHAFISNKVCDFALVQEKLPIELTVKVVLSRGATMPRDHDLEEILQQAKSPGSNEAKFFRALQLAGLDEEHANPQPDLKTAEKILRSLNLSQPGNIAYIVFLFEVLKLKGEQTPDLADELVTHSAYNAHVYDVKQMLQMKGATTTSLHAASLIEKVLPRPSFSRIVETLESEIRFSAKDEAQALVASTERILTAMEKRRPLVLNEYPVNDDLIPRKINELARNYLLLDARESVEPKDRPPSLNAAVASLKEERDDQDQVTKRCEKRPADERFEWKRKHD